MDWICLQWIFNLIYLHFHVFLINYSVSRFLNTRVINLEILFRINIICNHVFHFTPRIFVIAHLQLILYVLTFTIGSQSQRLPALSYGRPYLLQYLNPLQQQNTGMMTGNNLLYVFNSLLVKHSCTMRVNVVLNLLSHDPPQPFGIHSSIR